MGDTEGSIRRILAAVTNCPAGADLYFDLGAASVQARMLLVDLEEKFGIHIPDDQFIGARSISQLVHMMKGLSDDPAPHA